MKHITLFAGHYGSGKTNIAVSVAKYLKKQGFDTAVVDLDIVNPYFRTKDSEDEFKKLGIQFVCSEYANTNLDAPALPKEIYSVLTDENVKIIMDIGGDDRGAVALGRYTPSILEENDYDMMFVANCYRPLTTTPEEAFEVMREIEAACQIPFTAIVNNSNIGEETTAADVIASFEYIEKLSKLSGLPVKMTTATKKICEELKKKALDVFEIELQKKYYSIK
ncbi:MAG: hypothetical protein PUB42_04110 [Firmicutes bacterium]|nr:hypothetical protein [Bacillota bacterium]